MPLKELEAMEPSNHQAISQIDRETDTIFVDDRWFADRIGMKQSTIRSERFKRRHGLPHWLTVDSVLIGSKPRYRLSDALAWLKGRKAEQMPVGSNAERS